MPSQYDWTSIIKPAGGAAGALLGDYIKNKQVPGATSAQIAANQAATQATLGQNQNQFNQNMAFKQNEAARRNMASGATAPTLLYALGYRDPEQIQKMTAQFAAAPPALPNQGQPTPPLGTVAGGGSAGGNGGGGGGGSTLGTIGKVAGTIAATSPGLVTSGLKAAGGALGGLLGAGGGAAASGMAPIVGGTGFAGLTAATPPMTLGGIGAGASTAGTAGTSAGGGGSAIGGLLTNPITIVAGVGALTTALWLKSQAHWEANDIVQHLQNPFHHEILAPLSDAVATGQIPPAQGIEQLDAAWAKYQEDVAKFAAKGGDSAKVAQQSLATLSPLIAQMRADMTKQGGA